MDVIYIENNSGKIKAEDVKGISYPQITPVQELNFNIQAQEQRLREIARVGFNSKSEKELNALFKDFSKAKKISREMERITDSSRSTASLDAIYDIIVETIGTQIENAAEREKYENNNLKTRDMAKEMFLGGGQLSEEQLREFLGTIKETIDLLEKTHKETSNQNKSFLNDFWNSFEEEYIRSLLSGKCSLNKAFEGILEGKGTYQDGTIVKVDLEKLKTQEGLSDVQLSVMRQLIRLGNSYEQNKGKLTARSVASTLTGIFSTAIGEDFIGRIIARSFNDEVLKTIEEKFKIAVSETPISDLVILKVSNNSTHVGRATVDPLGSTGQSNQKNKKEKGGDGKIDTIFPGLRFILTYKDGKKSEISFSMNSSIKEYSEKYSKNNKTNNKVKTTDSETYKIASVNNYFRLLTNLYREENSSSTTSSNLANILLYEEDIKEAEKNAEILRTNIIKYYSHNFLTGTGQDLEEFGIKFKDTAQFMVVNGKLHSMLKILKAHYQALSDNKNSSGMFKIYLYKNKTFSPRQTLSLARKNHSVNQRVRFEFVNNNSSMGEDRDFFPPEYYDASNALIQDLTKIKLIVKMNLTSL